MNRITISLLFLGIFLYSANYAGAYVPEWHKPIPCIGCHQETANSPVGEGECGNCHFYKLNIELLQNQHNPKICKACHIGNTMVDASPKQIFHSGHSAINCTRCHTADNFTLIKIQNKNFECSSCHGNQIHGIHAQGLDRACPICHGSWAKDKVYKKENYSQTNQTNKINKDLERFTIFNFIKKLVGIILGT